MSGFGSARSVWYVRPLLEGLDGPDGSPSGGAHGGVFESSAPLGIGGAEPGGGGRVARGERADIPALDAGLRGGGRGRPRRPPARQGVGPAGSGRPGGGGGAPLPRALPGLHGQAFPRASGEGPWLRLGLHLAEAAPAMGGRRAKGPAQGRRSEEARAAAFAGHDAAPGWLAARLARRPSAARPDRDPG